jgi:hypothetical protein
LPTAAIARGDILLVSATITGPGGAVTAIPATNVSARVEELIEQHDGGDRDTAARRLGIAPDRLAGLLSGDWRRFSLEALAAAVRGYSVSLEALLAPEGGAGLATPALEREGTWQ